MRTKTYNLTLQTTSAVKIHLYRSTETPLGRFTWDPCKIGLGLFGAVLAGATGLFGGTLLASTVAGPVLATFSGLASSVLGSALCFLATIRG